MSKQFQKSVMNSCEKKPFIQLSLISNSNVMYTGSNIWSGNMDNDEEGRTSSAYF